MKREKNAALGERLLTLRNPNTETHRTVEGQKKRQRRTVNAY